MKKTDGASPVGREPVRLTTQPAARGKRRPTATVPPFAHQTPNQLHASAYATKRK